MKKVLLSVLFLFPSALFAESQFIGDKWGGLNNADSSMVIGNNEAQSLQDVDFTDSGAGIKKRSGYAQFRTIGVSTWGVRGAYYFRNSALADLVIHANSLSIFKSANSGAYSAFLTTATNGSYWDFADSLGFLYGANSNNDELWRYNGTTLTYFPNHVKGDQVEFTADRFVISGGTTNPKTVTFCKASDPTDCTTSSDEADAFTEQPDMPGQRVTAINSACGGLQVWTKDGMAFISKQDQYDLSPTEILSKTIGTIQPYSVVDDLGVTYWQGTDRHFYSFDCNGITKLSSKIDVSGIVSGESKNWEISSQDEFDDGTIGDGLTATESPGDVKFSSTGVLLDAFTDGDITASPAWSLSSNPFSLTTGSVSGGQFDFTSTSSGEAGGTNYLYGTTFTFSTGFVDFKYTPVSSNGSEASLGRVVISTKTDDETPTGYMVLFGRAAGGNTILAKISNGGTSTSLGSFSYTFSNGTQYRIRLSIDNAGGMNVYVDGTLKLSATDTTYSSFNSVHLGIGHSSGGTGTREVKYDDIYISTAAVKYISPSFDLGTAITAYGTVDINNVLAGGTISYAIYAHTGSDISTTTYTSSSTITNGSIPSFTVRRYALWTADFATTVSTQAPTLNDVTVNWVEGTITRHWGTVDKDHRIIWSVAEGTATVPNVSYVYDTRFDAWLKYNFPMDAAARVGDSLYFGGVSTGVVYQWPSGNTDAGSAITAFWKSKDFVGTDPTVEKWYKTLSFLTKTQTGSNLDITNTVNTSSATAENVSLTDSDGNLLHRINKKLPTGRKGTFFNVKFGNDDGDSPFEVYGIKFDYDVLPWRLLP